MVIVAIWDCALWCRRLTYIGVGYFDTPFDGRESTLERFVARIDIS